MVLLVHRPADLVTATRAVLAVGVAAVGPSGTGLVLVVVALALDLVDGQVARRTGTVSAFGARFDMEVDAFLIAVLSVYVAPGFGWWVLAIGAARYLLWLAERVWPWLRRPVPPRRWRKVVAAVQGVTLAVAASELLPATLVEAALVVALALLAESFGRDVWWLAHTRAAEAPYPRGGWRWLLALAAVWTALVLPETPADVLRPPPEMLLVVALALVPWRRARQVLSATLGLALGAVVVVRALDLGFERILDRPFDPATDWVYLGPGVGVLGDSIGVGAARGTAVVAGLLALALLALLAVAVVRVSTTAAAHRRPAVAAALAIALPAIALTPITQAGPDGAVALAVDEVQQVRADLADRRTFDREIATDRYGDARPDTLLRGLRGKDVLVVFVESYGRVAVEGSGFAPEIDDGVDPVLDDGTRRLRAAGWSSRSAFLTSPTFGAASWLAHSTLQSGLWVDSQRRYDQLLDADRLTLASAFEGAGWRTVFDVPANTRDWPEGADFYGFDQLYDSRNVGYRGPEFGYAPMPDQYTLERFRRLELEPADRRSGDGRDRPDLEPPPLGAVTRPGAVGPRRRWLGLRRHPDPARLLRRAPALRAVDRVHDVHAGVVPGDLPRPRPGARGARRPPAPLLRHRSEPGPRRADLRHRPRPVGHPPHLRLGLAARPAPVPGRDRLADGRLPRPVPGGVQPVVSRSTRGPWEIRTSTDAMSSTSTSVAPVTVIGRSATPRHLATRLATPSLVRTTISYVGGPPGW